MHHQQITPALCTVARAIVAMPLVTPRMAPVALLITSADSRADADAIRTRRRDAAGIVDRREGKNADAELRSRPEMVPETALFTVAVPPSMPTPAAPARIWPALFTVTEPAVPTARRPPVMVPVLLVTLMLPPVGPKLAMPKLPPEIVPAFATFATVVKSMPIDPPEMVPVLLVTLTVEAKISPAVQI